MVDDGSCFFTAMLAQIPIGAATRPVTLSALLVLTAVREPGSIIASDMLHVQKCW